MPDDEAPAASDFKLSASIMAPASCGACRFMVKDGGDLTCRFNPPQVTVVIGPLPQGPRLAGPNGQPAIGPIPFTMFPMVRPQQWCGQFQLAPRSQN